MINKLVEFSINSTSREEIIDITYLVKKAIKEAGIKSGIGVIYVPHTTAGVAINENADPSVKRDINAFLSKLVPHSGNYTHLEGNADSHIKSVLVGSSLNILIENGDLLLGTWQGIFFCEFDGPRKRKVFLKLIGE